MITPIETKEYSSGTYELLGIWEQKMSWGAVWTMELERFTKKNTKTPVYMIYHNGGQSYPVGQFRSYKKALECMKSMTSYTLRLKHN